MCLLPLQVRSVAVLEFDEGACQEIQFIWQALACTTNTATELLQHKKV